MSIQEHETGASTTAANDNVAVTVTKNPNCVVKFDITVQPKATEAAYQKAIKQINKEVNIPGFRKGKAPVNFVLEKYSSVIDKEFVDIALQTAFNEALQLTHLHPLKDGDMKRPVVKECSREKGAHFIIEFETRPYIPTIKPEDIELKKIEPIKVTDEARQDALHQVLLQFTTYEPITDHPAQENDFVNLTVFILEDSEQKIVDNQRVQINSKGLPSWMRAKVIGLKAGESAEGFTEQTATDSTPEFRPVPFRVTVNEVSKGILPALDDELAKKVGLQTIEELRQKVSERLEQEVQEEAYNLQIQALEEQLLEKYPIDLPKSYIDENTKSRMDSYLEAMAQQNRPATGDYKQIEQMMEASSIRSLQLYFLKRKVAADHHIEVQNDDVTQELTRQVALIPSGRSQIDIYSEKDKMHEQLYNLAMDRKIKDFLIGQAKLK